MPKYGILQVYCYPFSQNSILTGYSGFILTMKWKKLEKKAAIHTKLVMLHDIPILVDGQI